MLLLKFRGRWQPASSLNPLIFTKSDFAFLLIFCSFFSNDDLCVLYLKEALNAFLPSLTCLKNLLSESLIPFRILHKLRLCVKLKQGRSFGFISGAIFSCVTQTKLGGLFAVFAYGAADMHIDCKLWFYAWSIVKLLALEKIVPKKSARAQVKRIILWYQRLQSFFSSSLLFAILWCRDFQVYTILHGLFKKKIGTLYYSRVHTYSA